MEKFRISVLAKDVRGSRFIVRVSRVVNSSCVEGELEGILGLLVSLNLQLANWALRMVPISGIR